MSYAVMDDAREVARITVEDRGRSAEPVVIPVIPSVGSRLPERGLNTQHVPLSLRVDHQARYPGPSRCCAGHAR